MLPFEYKITCIGCGGKVIKRKNELNKHSGKRINITERLKYAEHKIFCLCIDAYKIFEGNGCKKIYEAISNLKNKKLKNDNTLVEKYENMNLYLVLEQDYFLRTAKGIYKIRLDSVRIMKWFAYYDRSYYENINYYDIMPSISTYIKEKSER